VLLHERFVCEATIWHQEDTKVNNEYQDGMFQSPKQDKPPSEVKDHFFLKIIINLYRNQLLLASMSC
jgi:hypothetical protein